MKQLYALVCETQRYSAVLDAVIASAGLLRAERKLRPPLAKVTGGVRRGGRESLPARLGSAPRRPRCHCAESLCRGGGERTRAELGVGVGWRCFSLEPSSVAE